MNRQNPYGSYDAAPIPRDNGAMYASNSGGYNNEGGSGQSPYYPSPSPSLPSHGMPPQASPSPYPNARPAPTNNYPPRDAHSASAYPTAQQPQHNFRPDQSSALPLQGGSNGRAPMSGGITLGPGPLNNQSHFGGPIRYDGSGQAGQYQGQPAPQRYPPEATSRPLPPPLRAQQQQPQNPYASHLPAKPNAAGHQNAPIPSPPAHLPRPPNGRDMSQEQPMKRARWDGGAPAAEETDDVIKERLKRERPCRTLFVRNIDFSANIDDLRRQFESFGEIKSWFDLSSKRGLLFISYFDTRAAEHAKVAMQDLSLNGRKMDVHFSLPREVDMTKRCDRDKDQGTLFILLKRAQGELNDDEVRATFSQFGEIKSLRRYKDQGNCRFIEFYDCRACKAAHDALYGQTWNGGTWDMKYAWDAAAPDRLTLEKAKAEQGGFNQGFGAPSAPLPYRQGGDANPSQPPPFGQRQQPYPPPHQQQQQQQQQYPPPNPTYPLYGGGPGTNGSYRPPPQQQQQQQQGAPQSYGTKRPFDYDEQQLSSEPPLRRWGQPQGTAAPAAGNYGAQRLEPGNGYNQGAGGYGRPPYGPPSAGGPALGGYGGAAPPGYGPGRPANYGNAGPQQTPPAQHNQPAQQPYPSSAGMPQRPPPVQQAQQAAPAADNRLEQAQKVQQLLASLKPASAVSSAPKASPVLAAAPAPAAPVPALPSNIAALLQMAQNNAGKK